jgi:hypothetical protein
LPAILLAPAFRVWNRRHVRLTLEAQRRLEGIELIAGLPLYPNPQVSEPAQCPGQPGVVLQRPLRVGWRRDRGCRNPIDPALGTHIPEFLNAVLGCFLYWQGRTACCHAPSSKALGCDAPATPLFWLT